MSKDDRELIELKPCPFCDGPGRIEHSYHEDNHRYPRDFWHVRASCSACGVSPTGWLSYGNQEQCVANVHVKQAAEADAIDRWNVRPATRLEALQAQPMGEQRTIDWRRIEDAIFEGLDANISCTQSKVRDLAKLLTARVTALSTPVAQGDEVREALHLAERAIARARNEAEPGDLKAQLIAAEHAVVEALGSKSDGA